MSRNDELVAVVTGGSRGIGKGVARALAEHGATVYIAGRSQAGGIHTSPGGALLPGTIQGVVEEVNTRRLSVTAYRTWTGTSRNLYVGSMAALILPLISNGKSANRKLRMALPQLPHSPLPAWD